MGRDLHRDPAHRPRGDRLLIAGDASTTLEQAVLAASGGGAALASHLVKGGLRLIVNTPPEPVTNIGVSVGENVAVAGVTSLAVLASTTAAVIALVLLVLGICSGAGSAAGGGGCGRGATATGLSRRTPRPRRRGWGRRP